MDAQPRRRLGGALLLAVLPIVAACGALAVVHFSGVRSGALPARAVPGVATTPGSGACVDVAGARMVWSDVNARLQALVLHPDVGRIAGVAQGAAATQMQQYLQQRLIDQHLTERELERLDDLSIVEAGCGSGPLTVRVTETLVQDDYIDAGGSVDHTDPGVGSASHVLESYVRSGDVWKVITISSLDQTPNPGTTV
ncbi:MAG TPA: hypothetical protein VGQ42_13240 [Candidatus Dormibacteraeota bacterium]|jgi:hypothetical protein|nr:hypothetical protein [Candidatus Dormibacteraeota bacterium]